MTSTGQNILMIKEYLMSQISVSLCMWCDIAIHSKVVLFGRRVVSLRVDFSSPNRSRPAGITLIC